MEQINEIKLVRKFNCKQKINYEAHLYLILRCQLIFQLLIIISTCIINLSWHFHLSHIYTTQFWTNEDIASSNLSLSFSSLAMIGYFIKFEETKPSLVKDLFFTVLFLHLILCILCSQFFVTFGYLLFFGVLTVVCVAIGSFVANVVEQSKLHSEISQIQMEDRKTYKKVKSHQIIISHDPNEHLELTQVQFQDSN